MIRPRPVPPEPAYPGFRPVLVTELDLEGGSVDTVGYTRVRVLGRLHGQPLGLLDLDLADAALAGSDLAGVVRERLADEIDAHLEACRDQSADSDCRTRRDALLQDPPAITVVIATRDRPRELHRCLTSLLQSAYPNFDVVVVDNDPSSDQSEAVAAATGRVRYVREPRRGLANAHNRGIAVASGEIIAFTDDDVEVDRDWLSAIAGRFAADPTVGCVTGLILPAALDTPAQLWVEEHGGFARGFAPRVFDLASRRPDDPLFPYTAGRLGSGANMAFRADVLDQMGGFDPAIGAGTRARGGDDLAAFFAVLIAGRALAYEPSAIVHHHHRPDWEGLYRQAHGYGVGLTAYLASAVTHNLRLVPALMPRIPAGLAHALSSGSVKNNGKGAYFPAVLTRTERIGMLRGPFEYLASRRLAAALGPGATNG